MRESHVEILVVGGGVGGCAAAIGATTLGKRVILTEVTDWLGGQLTSQAVPSDEHAWIDSTGCTRRYANWRHGVRQYYRDHYPLTQEARNDPHLNPGKGFVSAICHEPRVALAVIEQMLAYPRARGLLEVRLRRVPIAVEMQGDRARAVRFRDIETGHEETISADYILDATETGELLSLGKIEYVIGAEAKSDTGELHAAEKYEPDNVQAITWCFPMAYDPVGEHVIDKPAQYERWRAYYPKLKKPWPDYLVSWTQCDPMTLEAKPRTLFHEPGKNYWDALFLYRRILCRDHFLPGTMEHEVTLVNWPQNDYWIDTIIDVPENAAAERMENARQLSLSLLYWMQTDAPRFDGKGNGYPGLYLRPDMTGTRDGMAKTPYIRESRRIKAEFTVTEAHVGHDQREGRNAEKFFDSVGVGYYNIDLHPSTGGDNYIDVHSKPFQIPLGSLLPQRVENLLPACKNLGVTHITNGCYRLHPVEWNIGEAAGSLAAYCLENKVKPKQVRENKEKLADFQAVLLKQGFTLEWPWYVRRD